MARHKRKRTVAAMPLVTALTANSGETLQEAMTVEEYEAVRLIDYVGLTQSGAAERMGVARTTVQSIYFNARRKMARLLVNGGTMKIEGGDYVIAEESSDKIEVKNS